MKITVRYYITDKNNPMKAIAEVILNGDTLGQALDAIIEQLEENITVIEVKFELN